jgi:uncharacterized membrane protein YraQ (UPF0718 family)
VANCCSTPDPEPAEPSGGNCCGGDKRRFDYLLWGSALVVAAAYLGHLFFEDPLASTKFLSAFTIGVFELMNKMWWGLAAGILAMAVLSKVPREFVMSILGTGGGFSGLLRATGAGLMLDLCNHGILMVGAKLYERGASLGQLLAFLIASPWNSFSLTLILFALIGVPWTLAFIGLSMVVALITGSLVELLTARGRLPKNPNTADLPEGFRFFPEAKRRLRETRFTPAFLWDALRTGLSESRMILRWILFGAALTALLRAVMPDDAFAAWFGPTIAGLFLTLLATTVMEVCSEGSSPIAADLLTRAGAPGNAFTFLMAGAATDYTEIMVLRETTRSWKAALILPALTVPQVLLLGWILNQAG